MTVAGNNQSGVTQKAMHSQVIRALTAMSLGLGYSLAKNGNGANLVYMETIRDIIGNPNNANHPPLFNDLVANVEPVVTPHEALHRFFGWHDDNLATDEAIMNTNQLAAIQAIGSQTITARQFRMIQKTNYPH